VIVCPECGTRNEDGELFCGGCGTYLEWTEEPAAGVPAEPAPAEPYVAEPVAAPVAEPVTEPVAEPVSETFAEPFAEPVSPEAAVPDPVVPATPAEPEPMTAQWFASEPATADRVDVEPAAAAPATAEPATVEPATVEPAAARAAAPAAPDPVLAPVPDPVAEADLDAGVEVPHPRVAAHHGDTTGVALADAPPTSSSPTGAPSTPAASTPAASTPAAAAAAALASSAPPTPTPAAPTPAGSTPAPATSAAPGSAAPGSAAPGAPAPDTRRAAAQRNAEAAAAAATAASAAATGSSQGPSPAAPAPGPARAAAAAPPTAPPAAPQAAPRTGSPADRPPVTERVRPAAETEAIGTAAAAAGTAAGTATAGTAPGATRPGQAPVRPTTPAPPPQTPDARIAAAAAMVAPPPPPPAPRAPAPQQPAAVRPGVPKPPPAPKKVAVDEPPPAPGDLICGSCGAGNTPNRKFCRRCGHSLVDAKVQERRSWWSRLWRPDPKRGPDAGYRPRARRRFPTRPVVAIVMIGAIVALVLSFRPEIERGRITLLDRIQGNVAVNPTQEVASSEAPGHEAAKIRDGATNLSWSPAAPGDGVGQFVDFAFAEPFRLTRLLVIPGASDVEKDFLEGSSPKTLTLTVVTSAGTQQEVQVPLQDKVGIQDASFGIDDVVAIRMMISETYRATPETNVAIAEVEFRGRT